jgi:8-hydroxy-5-deazaflavin:NADPH oxidoreductase
MRIGLIGAGNMAAALGTQWAGAGHELMIAGRTPEKAQALARRIGERARAGGLRDAATFGDTVLVAVRREGVLDTLREAGAADGTLSGRTLIDCTNPIAEAEGFRLVTADRPSMARQIAELTGANVVKAFNLCHSSVYAMTPPVFADGPLGIPLCGDDEQARAVVRRLVSQMGAAPLDVGGLDRAGQLEATAATVIAILAQGSDPRTIIAPVLDGQPEPGEASPRNAPRADSPRESSRVAANCS